MRPLAPERLARTHAGQVQKEPVVGIGGVAIVMTEGAFTSIDLVTIEEEQIDPDDLLVGKVPNLFTNLLRNARDGHGIAIDRADLDAKVE